MYNDPKCKPWNSGNWAPPGYTDRKDLIEEQPDASVFGGWLERDR